MPTLFTLKPDNSKMTSTCHTPGLGILQLMLLANHHDLLIIINENPEQKLVRPSVGVDGNSGTHSFPECFSGVTESAMCVQS